MVRCVDFAPPASPAPTARRPPGEWLDAKTRKLSLLPPRSDSRSPAPASQPPPVLPGGRGPPFLVPLAGAATFPTDRRSSLVSRRSQAPRELNRIQTRYEIRLRNATT